MSARPGRVSEVRTTDTSLASRFRRHADALVRDHRSALCAILMYGAARDLESHGLTARLFADVPAPPGSVPQLRLLAALHHLVLAGRTPQLAEFYPSVGGGREAEGVWPAALATIERHYDWIKARLTRTVQTNEPGRSAALYPALLWLSERHGLPIRLLEIGASAGLNLIPDCYCYVVGGEELGERSSPVRFQEPWRPGPQMDLPLADERLRITARAGCDRNPLDPRDPEDRLTLMSYIWPDEPDRIVRMQAALHVAAVSPPAVSALPASQWLGDALEDRQRDELTVLWQSVFTQYVDAEEWAAIEDSIECAASADRGRPLVWLSLEPGDDHLGNFRLAARALLGERELHLADCGYHGPPLRWRHGTGMPADPAAQPQVED